MWMCSWRLECDVVVMGTEMRTCGSRRRRIVTRMVEHLMMCDCISEVCFGATLTGGPICP